MIRTLHRTTSNLDLSDAMFNPFGGPTGDFLSYFQKMKSYLPRVVDMLAVNEVLTVTSHPGYKKWIDSWTTLINDNNETKLFVNIQQRLAAFPQSLIHLDLHHHNILWRDALNGPEYVVFDFETIRRGPIGCDLVVFLCSCPRIKVKDLIDSLSDDERNSTLLSFVIKGATLAHHLMEVPLRNVLSKFLVMMDIYENFNVADLVHPWREQTFRSDDER